MVMVGLVVSLVDAAALVVLLIVVVSVLEGGALV